MLIGAVLAAFVLVSCTGAFIDSGVWGWDLAAPLHLTATVESSSVITLSWSPVSGASGYHVYHSPRPSGPFEAGTTTTSTTTRNYDLHADTTHYYRVSAFNSTGESPLSATVKATTFPEYYDGGGNPFTGVWDGFQHDGERIRAVLGVSTWTVSWPYHPDWVLEAYGTNSGTYTYSGNDAVFRIGGRSIGTGTVSRNTMSLYISGYGSVTLSR